MWGAFIYDGTEAQAFETKFTLNACLKVWNAGTWVLLFTVLWFQLVMAPIFQSGSDKWDVDGDRASLVELVSWWQRAWKEGVLSADRWSNSGERADGRMASQLPPLQGGQGILANLDKRKMPKWKDSVVCLSVCSFEWRILRQRVIWFIYRSVTKTYKFKKKEYMNFCVHEPLAHLLLALFSEQVRVSLTLSDVHLAVFHPLGPSPLPSCISYRLTLRWDVRACCQPASPW